jgi:hypothetical protein
MSQADRGGLRVYLPSVLDVVPIGEIGLDAYAKMGFQGTGIVMYL